MEDFVPTKSIAFHVDLDGATREDIERCFPDLPAECEIIDAHITLPADASFTASKRSASLRVLKLAERIIALSVEPGQEKLAAILDEYAISMFRGDELLYQSRGYVDQIMRNVTGGDVGSLVGAYRSEKA